MSDLFYIAVRAIGRQAFLVSSRATVIGTEHTQRDGAFIVAATHQSPYDVPLMIRHCKRKLDFVSIVEVFRNPFVAWFYGSMNAFPLDRSKPDSPTVRVILDRLARGRAIGMFPEGRIRKGEDSVVFTRKMRPGAARIAKLANVPIVPCVIVNSGAYAKFSSWLPLRRVRYGIIFGEAISADREAEEIERALIDQYVSLHDTLSRTLAP